MLFTYSSGLWTPYPAIASIFLRINGFLFGAAFWTRQSFHFESAKSLSATAEGEPCDVTPPNAPPTDISYDDEESASSCLGTVLFCSRLVLPF